MKKIMKVLIFLVVVLFVLVVAVKIVQKRKQEEASSPPAKSYALVVHTLTLHKKPCRLTLEAIAESKNLAQTKIASKIAGRVLYIVPRGSQVHKGDLLLQIDDAPLKAKKQSLKKALLATQDELRAAYDNLTVLKNVHRRSAALLKVGGVAKERFEQESANIALAQAKISAIQAKRASLQASLAEVEDLLSYTKIYASKDGVVVDNRVNRDDFASAGHTLLIISSKGETLLTLELPDTIHTSKVLYKGGVYPLQPLESSPNGALLYAFEPKIFIPDGAKERVQVITYEDVGYCVPKEALLGRKIVLYGKRALPKSVKIVGRGIEGIAIEGKNLEGKKMIVEKPDILLEALAGRPVKEQ